MNLQWNKTKRQKFLIAKSKAAASGVSCVFYKITRRSGIKIYDNRSDRDFAYSHQEKAFKIGFGPMAGAKLTIKKNSREARIVQKLMEDHWPPDWCCEIDEPHTFYAYITEVVDLPSGGISIKQLTKLEKHMEAAGFSTIDIGMQHNCGMRRGKPVCYDFDPCSMGL